MSMATKTQSFFLITIPLVKRILLFSLKAVSEIFINPPIWIPDTLHWENFGELFSKRGFGIITWNSLLLSTTFTVVTLFLCSLGGYAFAKYQFRGKQILFVFVLASLMIPHEATMVPLFVIYKQLHLIDNIWGVILPDLANAFGIFFMRQYCRSLPDEMLEAARIDGCSEFTLFRKVVLPNLKSAFAALGISVLPLLIIVLVFQKQLISGLTEGSVKG